MRTIAIRTAAATLGALTLAGAGALSPAYAGVSGPAFWVDGELYRTVATPTDLSTTGAPAHTYDAIYSFAGHQRNVAEAAPGDRDYNGGRWMVIPVEWSGTTPSQVTSADDLIALEATGSISFGAPVKYFECPVIPMRGNGLNR